MSLKKKLFFLVTTIVLGSLIYLAIAFFTNEPKEKKKENEPNIKTKEAVAIDYKTYQELRSEVHENETFAILIMNYDDEISLTFKQEVLTSFNNRQAKVYTIDTNKLSDVELSGIIDDVTNIYNYDKPTITIPTLLVMKKGKVVYKQAGLLYSPDIISNLDKKKIE